MATEFAFDDAIDALSAATGAPPLSALQWLLDHWPESAPRCRALLAAYVDGNDVSERTERALFFVVHALGEKGDTAAFPDMCRLVEDADRSNLVLGDDSSTVTLPRILVSTFGGDPAPLQRLVESEKADELIRGDVLLVLAYLTRTRRLTCAWMQDYLAGLPDRLRPQEQNLVWFGWVQAVAALGYSGLAAVAEDLMRRGLVDPTLLTRKDFWQDLRDSQAIPDDMTSVAWNRIGPMGSSVAELSSWGGDSAEGVEMPPQPVVNPLRHVGRNDPCPCGSGRKFKKCCLDAGFKTGG